MDEASPRFLDPLRLSGLVETEVLDGVCQEIEAATGTNIMTLVRRFADHRRLKPYIRVTVGTPAENELFLEALREILG